MLIANDLSIYPYGARSLVNYNKYYWSALGGLSGQYVHFKTDVTLNTNKMVMVEAVGINYYGSAPVRCSWCWYAYSYLYSVGTESIYGGVTADGVYMSSDGYVVFRARGLSELNDTAFSLNIYNVCPAQSGANVNITAVNRNTNSGSYY